MNNLSRRNVLKMAGVTLALPFLESFGKSQSQTGIKRFVAMQTPYGYLPNKLYPSKNGSTSPYLSVLKPLKGSLTLFNGFYNPGVNSGHDVVNYYLTCGKKDSAANTISLDQQLASTYKGETRFKCLVAGGNVNRVGLSWTRSGIRIPVQYRPDKVFTKMFLGGSNSDVQKKMHELSKGKSILDSYKFYSSKFKNLTHADKQRMEQYFTAVRDVEQSLEASKMWIKKPFPKVGKIDLGSGSSRSPIENFRTFTKIIKLAFENDSTRIATFDFGEVHGKLDLDGVDDGYHTTTHHNKLKDKLSQLELIEKEFLNIYCDFLKDLKEANLLDSTISLFGSAMYTPNNHSAETAAVLIAGGGLKHKWYQKIKRQPLGNLYVDILEKMGQRKPSFGTSTGKFTL